MILNDIETSKQARLVLRELIRGNKSRAQLWSALVDNQLDDVDLRFILPPLEQDGYIEESDGKWQILPKGVKYMDTYDRMMMESVECYPCPHGKPKETEDMMLQRKSFKWTRISVVVSIIIALIGWLLPHLDGVIGALLSLFRE